VPASSLAALCAAEKIGTQEAMGERIVILGVAASDAHAVGNRLIAMQLELAGFTVINLGTCTTLEEFAAALRSHPEAEAVAIGSVNGHAFADLSDLPQLRERGELRCPLIVGGNLSVGSNKTGDEADRLRELGVDYVLRDPDELIMLLDSLRESSVCVS
jgi:methylaspartate mutase sigma subunit